MFHFHGRSKPEICRSVALGAAGVAAALFTAATPRTGWAANVLLADGNSSVTIDPTSSAGVENWSINGQNQINQEWFWFRNGSSGGQSSLDSLGTPSVSLFDTSGDGNNDIAMLTYGSTSGIQITVTYSLTGGATGSHTSDLGETIKIDNDGSSSVNYHFFEYANFNLGGSTTGQTVTLANANTATDTGNGYQVQTVVSPVASEYEANLHPSLINHVSSATSPYTLSDATSTPAGDAEWGFEWDQTIKAGGSYAISGDEQFQGSAVQPVPEPVSGPIALMGIGGLFMTRRRRRDLPRPR